MNAVLERPRSSAPEVFREARRSAPAAEVEIPAPAPEPAVQRRPDEQPEAPQGPAPAAPAPAERPNAETPAAGEKKGGKRRLVFMALGLIALAALGYFGWSWWTVGRFMVSTDDAYVQADVTTIVTKVSGYITKINVKDNATVKAGDVLAEIDPVDYELAIQAAKDKITAAEATIARIGAQIPAAEAAVQQAQANLEAQQATLLRAQADFARAEQLAASNYGSKQNLDAARAERDNAIAAIASAKAGLAQAQANVEVTKSQQTEQQAILPQLHTQLATAERDLSFTKIRAPADGVVGNRAIDVGSYVSAGTRAMALVPTDTIYVAANFKETQLAAIVPGQEVDLSVDALEKIDVKGRVESIAPASGSVFSLLPVENATGNFTKIVQRVPVRIAVSADDALRAHLRPGLSVVASVDTRTTPPGTKLAGN